MAEVNMNPLARVDVMLRNWVPSEKQNAMREAINAAIKYLRDRRETAQEHVAYCRYVNHGQDEHGADILTIETCDSDAEGAFRVYR
jgi:hypothetical protein